MMLPKAKQRKLNEKPQKKGIKIPFYVIVFLVVFGVTFIGRVFDNDNSAERKSYMDVKYEDQQPEPDPFQKPQEEPVSGGGSYQTPVNSLTALIESSFGSWFVVVTAFVLALPIVMIFMRGFRRW